ncbi:PPPDE putative peptidase domain-containing protein [Sphaerosporella brunnea]|uniref:PPPDE putative peptidase domain-containing protein n=1 Tax=Sphaerosporella brunnea TaxID=1250544 RepID=A0A5J5ESZ7_9PEZI|nr:PPPDE putative peptidase domain-containing protein [Sphaerosporella brunnea]
MAPAEQPVELYVYDLSQGLARQMSMAFLGIQIDAVYHTSIVVGGIEYYFGHGIQTSYPGQTHHGEPMEIIKLGTTSLPEDILHEYVESMKLEYTPESYDLFLRNCNNFTADLSMFLCGVSIPGKIKNLPQEVLNTPFGQMMRPALERQLRPITTAHVKPPRPKAPSRVRNVTALNELENIIKTAPATVVFFTSATCAPCRVVYPQFETLASEAGEKATFVKVDISHARPIAEQYQILATPTFMTWSKGEKLDEWKGASVDELKQKVDLVLRVTYPIHRHTSLSIPTALRLAQQAMANPTVFSKVPPVEKVAEKLGSTASNPAVQSLIEFLRHRAAEGAVNAPIPNEAAWASFLQNAFNTLPSNTLFPLVDLFRASLADPRVSDTDNVPYPLRLVTTQALCNLFTTPLFPPHLVSQPLLPLVSTLTTTFLLDSAHSVLRAAASSVAFAVAAYVQKQRSTANQEVLPQDAMVELVAGLVQGIQTEKESEDVVRQLVLSLALLCYCVPDDQAGELKDMLGALEAGKELKSIAAGEKWRGECKELCKEVAQLVDA